MKNKVKKLDAVQIQRAIREKLHKMYQRKPELRAKHLAEIHKKYGLKPTTRQ